MKKAMKVLGILLCAVLLVVGSVAATLAYLTATSVRVTNTFSVGNVELKLTEAEVDANGAPVIGADNKVVRREEGNSYKLIPGNTYTKDPTVEVLADSEASYVRMMVTINGAEWKDIKDCIYYLNGNVATNGVNPAWKLADETGTQSGTSYTYEFRYVGDGNTPTTTTAATLPALFNEIRVDANIAEDALAAIEGITQISIIAHAIQADGFEDNVAGAWAALDAAYANA